MHVGKANMEYTDRPMPIKMDRKQYEMKSARQVSQNIQAHYQIKEDGQPKTSDLLNQAIMCECEISSNKQVMFLAYVICFGGA